MVCSEADLRPTAGRGHADPLLREAQLHLRGDRQDRDRADPRGGLPVILHSARPGLIIGRKGAEVDRLREQLEELSGRRITVNIVEIAKPELNGQLVAENVAQQLKKRASFRRTMKQAADTTMSAGAKGVKVRCAGRLGGTEMSRAEVTSRGSIPLQTLDGHIDYGFAQAYCTYGVISVKV